MLERRLELLRDTRILAELTEYTVFADYTCERAMIFFNHYLKTLWQGYVDSGKDLEDQNTYYKQNFPFKQFISYYLHMPATEEN